MPAIAALVEQQGADGRAAGVPRGRGSAAGRRRTRRGSGPEAGHDGVLLVGRQQLAGGGAREVPGPWSGPTRRRRTSPRMGGGGDGLAAPPPEEAQVHVDDLAPLPATGTGACPRPRPRSAPARRGGRRRRRSGPGPQSVAEGVAHQLVALLAGVAVDRCGLRAPAESGVPAHRDRGRSGCRGSAPTRGRPGASHVRAVPRPVAPAGPPRTFHVPAVGFEPTLPAP